jgi:hypothetical protein
MEKGMATVSAGWLVALNQWDAKAQAVYLEWEVRGAGDAHECMCDNNEVGRVEKNWVAEVVVDGAVVAEQSHEEAGAVVGGLSLGRHIGLVILKDVCTSTVVRNKFRITTAFPFPFSLLHQLQSAQYHATHTPLMHAPRLRPPLQVDKEISEFQLQFHTHLVITEPAQRAVLTPDEVRLQRHHVRAMPEKRWSGVSAPATRWRSRQPSHPSFSCHPPEKPFLVCVELLLSALCIDRDSLDGGGSGDDEAPQTGCQASGDVTVLVDGSPVANISDVSYTDRGCAFISPFSGPVPRHGKVFAITAEMQVEKFTALFPWKPPSTFCLWFFGSTRGNCCQRVSPAKGTHIKTKLWPFIIIIIIIIIINTIIIIIIIIDPKPWNQAKGTPISKLHHVSLPGEFGFNAEWMSRKASLSAEGLIQDAVISAQALEGDGYINPCVYRSGMGWRVTFRRHHIRMTEAEDEEIPRYNANLLEPSLQVWFEMLQHPTFPSWAAIDPQGMKIRRFEMLQHPRFLTQLRYLKSYFANPQSSIPDPQSPVANHQLPNSGALSISAVWC